MVLCAIVWRGVLGGRSVEEGLYLRCGFCGFFRGCARC